MYERIKYKMNHKIIFTYEQQNVYILVLYISWEKKLYLFKICLYFMKILQHNYNYTILCYCIDNCTWIFITFWCIALLFMLYLPYLCYSYKHCFIIYLRRLNKIMCVLWSPDRPYKKRANQFFFCSSGTLFGSKLKSLKFWIYWKPLLT